MAVISKAEMLDSLLESAEKMIATGEKPVWQRPWEPRYGEFSAPHNPTTGKAYSSLNTMILTVAALEHGYEDPRWMGYSQAKEAGYSVRKGEKAGARIYSPIIKTVRDEESGQDVTRPVGYRATPLFNAAQIEGIPPLRVVPEAERQPKSHELDAIAAQMGVVIVHATQDRAYYRSDLDRIHLPMREQFPDQHGYDATKAHELAHATGQSSRLDRDSLKTYAKLESRAAEEVTAEIGAYLTSLHLGIPYMGDSPDMTEEQHAAYVASWGKNLTRDERRLAVDNGLKAAVYLEKQLELARQQGLLQEQDIEKSTTVPGHEIPAAAMSVDTENTHRGFLADELMLNMPVYLDRPLETGMEKTPALVVGINRAGNVRVRTILTPEQISRRDDGIEVFRITDDADPDKVLEVGKEYARHESELTERTEPVDRLDRSPLLKAPVPPAQAAETSIAGLRQLYGLDSDRAQESGRDTLETAPGMMKSMQSSPERENTDDGLEIGF